MATKLLATVTADGAAGAYYFPGGLAMIHAYGTWGGATIKLQASTDGTNYDDVRDDDGFTAEGVALLTLPPCWRQVNAASTGTTSVKVAVRAELIRAS